MNPKKWIDYQPPLPEDAETVMVKSTDGKQENSLFRTSDGIIFFYDENMNDITSDIDFWKYL